ncbi:hypothetical protein [Parvibaculum sp.]|uniref:hypothetical protein n=1 Tax=Parvibaculum sp. TaxID=2024848 RepID=UPI002BAB8609|nr:hypothetical protein [Parvibaculum sp.]HUD53195.1 hypothetical protein [Parvibaculum sp.]
MNPIFSPALRRVLSASFAVQAIILAGCIPQGYNYFEPSAPSGHVEQWRGACGGAYDHITFTAPNYSWVQVRLSTSEFDYDKRVPAPLTVYLTIRKHIPSEFGPFADEEKQAVYNSWQAQKISIAPTAGSIDVSWQGGGHASLPISFPDAKAVLVLDEKKDFFEQKVVIPGFAEQSFDVQLPTFLIDGVALEFPPVHFQRVDKILASAINC